MKILILCTGNSARSQMAEGLLRHLIGSGGAFEISSAGTKPGIVRPEAVEVLNEIGIDISAHRSKSIDEFAEQKFDFVITVCDNAQQNCPYFPAQTKFIHHGFDDPAAVAGEGETRLAIFRRVRDEIQTFLKKFVREEL